MAHHTEPGGGVAVVAAAATAFALLMLGCGGGITAEERVSPAATADDAASGADGDAAVTDAADAAPKPVDPAELLCRASPAATPHRVAGSDCPSSGCTSCDDATDCEPGSVCVHSLTKGPEYIECLPRDAPYGTHAYTYDAWQACVQDCECLPRYGDRCVSGRCAAR